MPEPLSKRYMKTSHCENVWNGRCSHKERMRVILPLVYYNVSFLRPFTKGQSIKESSTIEEKQNKVLHILSFRELFQESSNCTSENPVFKCLIVIMFFSQLVLYVRFGNVYLSSFHFNSGYSIFSTCWAQSTATVA